MKFNSKKYDVFLKPDTEAFSKFFHSHLFKEIHGKVKIINEKDNFKMLQLDIIKFCIRSVV